jgi:putative transposon-encoded protein
MEQVQLIKTVKPIGNTGHITIPKRYIGKLARVIIKDDEREDDKNDCKNRR